MSLIHDTIVAIATPQGEGAIGIIRLSGADAFTIAGALFRGKNLSAQPTHTIHFGRLQEGEELLDETVASLFRGPKSYTGEDTVEFSCHGSPYVLERVVNACARQGARLARPGEFTQRAFLNGKLDLAQAEAVADLIASRTAAAQRSALYNLRGGFSSQLKDMRERLLQFSALIELELDFSQEDVEFADRQQLYGLIQELTAATEGLVRSFQLGNVVKNGVAIAIVGKPNAGKSTLLNALLNEERAIVSDIAGTTRDTIEETMNVDGILFRFIDTAGIRSNASDVIEEMGIKRSRRKAEEADAVVYVYDGVSGDAEELIEAEIWLQGLNKPYLIAVNKWDKMQSLPIVASNYVIPMSAKNGTGIESLTQQLRQLVAGGTIRAEDTLITNARHHAVLEQLLGSLREVRSGMDNGLPGDLLALDIRRCLHYIGEITGAVTTEDTLDVIFSKFCIGK